MRKYQFTETRKFSESLTISIFEYLRLNPSGKVEIIFLGDVFFQLGAIAILGIMLKEFDGRIRLDYERLGKSARDHLKNIGIDGTGKPSFSVLPITHIVSQTDLGSIFSRVDSWISGFAKRVFHYNSGTLGSVAQLCYELVNNVVDHAQSRGGGVICGQFLAKRNHIQIVVTDLGQTIPGTLGPTLSNPGLSDHDILVKSMDERVSRRLNQSRNYGMGLNIVKRAALFDPESCLIVKSRNGFVSVSKSQLHSRKAVDQFHGTLVHLTLSDSFLSNSAESSEELVDFEV